MPIRNREFKTCFLAQNRVRASHTALILSTHKIFIYDLDVAEIEENRQRLDKGD